jgi:hypothetical protein
MSEFECGNGPVRPKRTLGSSARSLSDGVFFGSALIRGQNEKAPAKGTGASLARIEVRERIGRDSHAQRMAIQPKDPGRWMTAA